MKRFSMAMTWLALAGLMTTVSCRKPVVGFTNGEARTVTVSAVTESGGGSKTSIDGLNVKWSENDQIKMNAESVLTLEDECVGSTMGRFTGEVTGVGPYRIGYPAGKTTYDGETLKLNIPASWAYDADMKEIVPMVAYAASVDDDVYFRNAVNMLKLQLKGDGTAASKLTSIVLTSTESNLSGDIRVTFEGTTPTFNAITDGEDVGNTMTVSFGEGLQLKADEVKCVYIPLARISGGDLTVRFDCANGRYMEKKVTADSNFDAVNNMLGDVVEVRAVPVFSVGENTTVEFSPGNLYYDGSSWQFEANQWDFRHYNGITGDAAVIGGESMTTPAGTVGSFFWNKDAVEAKKEDFDWPSVSDEDVFFTNSTQTTANPDFHVNGETGTNTWRTLSEAEWNYLLGFDPMDWDSDSYGRSGAKGLCEWKELDDGTHNGLVILPDGTENPSEVLGSITLTSDLATHGAVFLPAAGYRCCMTVGSVGPYDFYGFYWTSALEWTSTIDLFFGSNVLFTGNACDPSYGCAVRLVR